MSDIYRQIVINLRNLMARILEPRLDLDDFLAYVARAAKQLNPTDFEARVYEVDFNENTLYLKTSTQLEVNDLTEEERTYSIRPRSITGDAIIENRVIVANRLEGYAQSRFINGEEVRAAFPIEFFDTEMPEGRTKYVLIVSKKVIDPIEADVLAALKDYSILAGLAISIKEFRDKLSRYYEENRNLALTGQHSAAIAHDLRSLNVGIGGFLAIALRHLHETTVVPTMGNILKYLTMAQDSSGQMESLLKNFAQFNKTDIDLHRDTDLTQALKNKVESLSNRLEFGKMVRFDLSIAEDYSGLLVDKDWFGTVIENLVKNSVEACGGTTIITIRLKTTADLVVLTIGDNCGGIPPAQLPDLFTPFKTTKKSGQGLGLANAKKVVEDHGGRIDVANVPGKGVIFTIRFIKNNKPFELNDPWGA
jgi:signal transduction histidine kinase